MSLSLEEKTGAKLRLSVSVNTKEPATKGVRSSTDTTVSASRTLWARRLRRPTRIMGLDIGSGLQPLHALEDGVGGGGPQLVDDAAVAQEQHPVGVAGRPRVVGDDDDGLAQVIDR